MKDRCDTRLVLFIRSQSRHRHLHEKLKINILKSFIEHHFFFRFLIQQASDVNYSIIENAEYIFIEGSISDEYASCILNHVKKNGAGLLYFNALEGESLNVFDLITLKSDRKKYQKIRFMDILPNPFKPLEGLTIDYVTPQLVRQKNSNSNNSRVLAYIINNSTLEFYMNPVILIGSYGKGKIMYSAIPPKLQNWFYIGHNDISQNPIKSPPFITFCFQWLMSKPFARFSPHKNGAIYEYMIRFDDIDFNWNLSRTKTYFNTWLEKTNYPINIAIIPRNMKRNPSLVHYLTELREKYGKRVCLLKHGSDHENREIGEYTAVVPIDYLHIKKGLNDFEKVFAFSPHYSAEPNEEAPIHVLDIYAKDGRILGVCTAIIPTSYGLGGGFHSTPYKSLFVIPTTSKDISYAKRWSGTITKPFHPQSPKSFMKKVSLFIKNIIKVPFSYFLLPKWEALRHINALKSLRLDDGGVVQTYEEKTLREYVKSRIKKTMQYNTRQNLLKVSLNCSTIPLDLIKYTKGITLQIVPRGKEIKSIYLDEKKLHPFLRGNLYYAILPKVSRREHFLKIYFD